MKKYDLTVVIPAHNEEKYVARCIRSIKKSAANFGGSVEMIVVCNRCTDKTAEIAEKTVLVCCSTRTDALHLCGIQA